MTLKHGVYISETSSAVQSMIETDSAIPFVVGTASGAGAIGDLPVNEPKLIYSFEEYVQNFGYTGARQSLGALKKYEFTLDEFARSFFRHYSSKPAVFVNVLDPASAKKSGTVVTSVTFASKNGQALFGDYAVIPDSITLTKPAGGDPETDPAETYTVEAGDFSVIVEEGIPHLQAMREEEGSGAWKVPTDTALTATYEIVSAETVTFQQIVGGYTAETGKRTGLELIKEVFPRFRLVPGLIVSPHFSKVPTVALAMASLAENISDMFVSLALIDLPSATITIGGQELEGPTVYSAVPAWKNENSLTDKQSVLTWPNLSLDGEIYAASSHLAGLMAKTDNDNGGIPFVSPSNKALAANKICSDTGEDIWLDVVQANYLNANGVNTAAGFLDSWVYWGNFTAYYPSTESKDYFIPVRRMFNWLHVNLILNYWSRIDVPATRRQIESIVDSANIWLNSLTASGYILGGRVEFNQEENPTQDMAAGKLRFHVYYTPAPPAQEITFVLEYDASYLSVLYGT